METYIPITWLNDFVFCPYSIYLHNVYGAHHTDVYHSSVQQKGLNDHRNIDKKTYSTLKGVLTSLNVFSDKYNILGVVDLLDTNRGYLVERKRQISKIYDGYKYQLYAQYFCLIEMGYEVKELFFFATSSNTKFPIPIPSQQVVEDFEKHLNSVKTFDPAVFYQHNQNKCLNCIYVHLCDKYSCDEE